MINKNSPIPVYYQLKEDIKEKINMGIWKIGQYIDSERELAEHYNVSRMTIRQALGELVQEGILIKEKGKGTFVCEPKVKQMDIMSFSDMVNKMGLELKTEIVQFEKISTPKKFEGLLSSNYIYIINRLRLVEGEVIANEIVYIPCQYLMGVSKKDLRDSLYKILGDRGYIIDHSEASIEAVLMDEEYKRLFKTEKNMPLIKSVSKNIGSDGKLLFIEESVYRSDKYILEVNIYRREGKIK